jgi:hypothetical protein
VAILAGSASGYLIGYGLFVEDLPSCHSGVVLEALSDPSYWQKLQREKLKRAVEGVGYDVDGHWESFLNLSPKIIDAAQTARVCSAAPSTPIDKLRVRLAADISNANHLLRDLSNSDRTVTPDDWAEPRRLFIAASVAVRCGFVQNVLPSARHIDFTPINSFDYFQYGLHSPTWKMVVRRILIWGSGAFRCRCANRRSLFFHLDCCR